MGVAEAGIGTNVGKYGDSREGGVNGGTSPRCHGLDHGLFMGVCTLVCVYWLGWYRKRCVKMSSLNILVGHGGTVKGNVPGFLLFVC